MGYRFLELCKQNFYALAMGCLLLTAVTAFSSEDELREDLFLSTTEQIAALRSVPDDLIGGLINPLSGLPVLKVTDLIAKGAQDIVLSRTYVPPHIPTKFPQHIDNQEQHEKKHLYYHLRDHYKGWQFYPHIRLQLNPSTMAVRLAESNGVTVDFRLSGSGYSHASLATHPYAISNLMGDLPSGCHDLRNTRIAYEESENRLVVRPADGSTRTYLRRGWATRSSHLYLLDKEILPNGKVLKYHYDEKGHLSLIQSLDPKERYVYSSLRVNGSAREGSCRFTSSSGLSTDYQYIKRPIHWKIKEKMEGGGKHKEECSLTCPPILARVSSPFYRDEALDYSKLFLLSSYLGKDEVFNLTYMSNSAEAGYDKVGQLLFPVGKEDAFVPVYQLIYQPPVPGKKGGKTTVKGLGGEVTVIEFSDQLLQTAIQTFLPDGSLQKEKVFKWNSQNWLKTLEIWDGRQNLLYRRSYEYDSFGNPIRETIAGDLTGCGEEETFTTMRKFSEDGRNLLLREEGEDGKVVCFNYLPNTNLKTSTLIKDREKILLREFWIYDDCHNLIQAISDDGSSEDCNDLSGVSQRTVKIYTLRQSEPFLHMPEWIEERFLEGDAEKILKRTHLSYDEHGNVAEEAVYDGDGRLGYTISKTYNERGDVLTETNCLGQQAAYTYDPKGRLKTSLSFSHRIHATFRYDMRGRVRERVEKGADGSIRVSSSDYDEYDRAINFDNGAEPLTKQAFDPFGRLETKTDAQGGTTTYRYNAYGSPVEIVYPNGQREIFRYAKNGFLTVHTNLEGMTIGYERDLLGQVTKKSYYSANGDLLAQEAF